MHLATLTSVLLLPFMAVSAGSTTTAFTTTSQTKTVTIARVHTATVVNGTSTAPYSLGTGVSSYLSTANSTNLASSTAAKKTSTTTTAASASTTSSSSGSALGPAHVAVAAVAGVVVAALM